jgi:hypothetical protein
MRIIAFVLDEPTIERILDHIGEPTQAPARSPPQGTLPFDQTPAGGDWPDGPDGGAGQRLGVIPEQIRRGCGAAADVCGGWRSVPAVAGIQGWDDGKQAPTAAVGQAD